MGRHCRARIVQGAHRALRCCCVLATAGCVSLNFDCQWLGSLAHRLSPTARGWQSLKFSVGSACYPALVHLRLGNVCASSSRDNREKMRAPCDLRAIHRC